jgi:hypothetical protein
MRASALATTHLSTFRHAFVAVPAMIAATVCTFLPQHLLSILYSRRKTPLETVFGIGVRRGIPI